jgi:hypothetical protein
MAHELQSCCACARPFSAFLLPPFVSCAADSLEDPADDNTQVDSLERTFAFCGDDALRSIVSEDVNQWITDVHCW